ncbi:spindolin [Vibrio sp. S11_S32]|uniref:lytic polysaccharide monooxygenase n=1 Tax=Vibrio sp. S11_S32 TaxID=2720225 RepID=UPI0016811D19|nr:lytic polysaccharide monooxygenase [Vibrio sp. S11_S32]MBD1576227.1 spindolin [Vibrio sp. S11_S32]
MKTTPLSISALLGVIGLSALSSNVQAHGYMDYPPARQQICDIDGGYWDSSDGHTIPNAACRAAFIESSWTPFVQKPEFATLVSNYNNQTAVETAITDGNLCSAGDKAKHGIDLPSPDWQKTKVDLTNNGKITLQYRANTPHNPSFWKIYLSKPSYDSATMPLAWTDLELIADFGNLPIVTLNGLKYYQMEVTLPSDRSGDAVLYSRWQRQDPAGEGFYNCSDISFSGNDNGDGGNDNPLDKWITSGNYLASTVDASVGDSVWFRVFDENGNETVFEKFTVTNDDEHVWGQDLANVINQKYAQQVQIGLKNNSTTTIEYQTNDLYSNLVYLTHSNHTQRLEVKTGNNAPVISAPTQLSVESGKSIIFDVSVSDADNDPLMFSVDKGTILSQTATSVTINYQAAVTDVDSSDSLTVSVGDPASTTTAVVTIAISAEKNDDGGNGGETTWNADTIYNTGDTVLFAGITYTAKWWIKGETPNTSAAWEAQRNANDTQWQSNLVYTSDDVVSYNGSNYKAQWWTKGNQPDQGGPWKKQ